MSQSRSRESYHKKEERQARNEVSSKIDYLLQLILTCTVLFIWKENLCISHSWKNKLHVPAGEQKC